MFILNTIDIFFLWGAAIAGTYMGYGVIKNPNINYHLFSIVLFFLSYFNFMKGTERIAHDYPNMTDIAMDGLYFLAFCMGLLFYNKSVSEEKRV